MVDARRDAPLSVLDRRFFLAGVLIDPTSIVYTIKEPGGAVAVDEDGETVSGRVPLRAGTGHYHAGNTTLGKGASIGTYSIEWTVEKTPASSPLVVVDSFEVVDTIGFEDASRQGQTRHDIPLTDRLKELRAAIQDNKPDDTKLAFFNSELQAFLDRAIAVHTEGKKTESTADADEIGLAMLLAQCSAFRALAKDATRFFRWQDGNESVDKSMVPRNLLDICKSLMDEYNGIRRNRREEKEAGVQDIPRAGRRMEFRRR